MNLEMLIDRLKTAISGRLQRWVMALVCRWRGHHYSRWYHYERHWRQMSRKKGKHMFKEFQYECNSCKAKTKWIKWRYKEAFERQHGFHRDGP